MLPLATNRSTAAQKGNMLSFNDYKALSGAGRKAALVKLTAAKFGPLTQNQRGDLWDIASLAFTSESEAMKMLATTLQGMTNDAPRAPSTDLENGPDGSEAEKKDTPALAALALPTGYVGGVDFGKLELAIVASAPKNDGKADLGCNFRDRHPECFGKREKRERTGRPPHIPYGHAKGEQAALMRGSRI